MQYEHTQIGRLHWLVYGIAAVLAGAAWLASGQAVVGGALGASAVVVILLGFCFHWMKVFDAGDCLAIRYGPVPLFQKSIRYADITSVEPGTSSLVDGWGIHYVPGRGWTYNLWGYGCVVVRLGKKVIRVGSDDVENLAEFLTRRIESSDG